jgi:UDPglucose 6-dehydrogenase
MLFPDMILVGESDPRAGAVLAEIYKSVCENDPPVMHMNWVNAELTKISINTYVTTRISYVNMLSDIRERLPGADVDIVTRALGADSRIGKKYLKGALGYGGPCFPRDNVAFSRLARGLGARADLAEATDNLNRYQIDRLAAAASRLLDGGSKVGILGLSYKPETAVIEESQGLALAARLSGDRREVYVHDPMALASAISSSTIGFRRWETARPSLHIICARTFQAPCGNITSSLEPVTMACSTDLASEPKSCLKSIASSPQIRGVGGSWPGRSAESPKA